jgi:hypothetical protein
VLRLHRAGGPDAASCIDACAVSPQWVLR